MHTQHIEEGTAVAHLRDRMSRASNKEGRRDDGGGPSLIQGIRASQVRTQRPVFHEPKTRLFSLIESLNA